jgi:hypothetical protein
MGCNAWNHPSNCHCGWGGVWYGQNAISNHSAQELKTLSYYSEFWRGGRRGNYETYTIPNAACPVCGKPVFFYQSSYGGRVFFDDLGPPWPKHPCTDNSQNFIPKAYLPNVGQNPAPLKWQEDGWEPVEVLTVSENSALRILTVRRIETDGLIINLGLFLETFLPKDSLVFIKEKDDLGIFEISYLDMFAIRDRVQERKAIAYRNCYSMQDVEAWQQASMIQDANKQIQVAFNILFCNQMETEREIDVNDKKIDLDAARYWLTRASKNGSEAANHILKTLDLLLLKNKLQGISC